jgi:hypothetical protein
MSAAAAATELVDHILDEPAELLTDRLHVSTSRLIALIALLCIFATNYLLGAPPYCIFGSDVHNTVDMVLPSPCG